MKKPLQQKRWGQRRGFPPVGSAGLGGKLAVLGAVLAGLLAVAGLGGLLVWQQLGQSAFFQITSIRIEGNVRTTKKEVLALSGVDVHSNLLALSAGKVRARIETHDWIEAAEVRRDWPNRLEITVQERRPLALLNLPAGLYYTDRSGVPFAGALPPEDLDFPVITGLDAAGDWRDEQRQALQRALSLIRLAGRGGVILPAQGISEINLGEEGTMTLFLVSRPFPIYLGESREVSRNYNRLAQVLNWLYKERVFTDTAAIRMDYLPDRILVERGNGG